MEILEQVYFGNSIRAWWIAAAAALSLLLALRIFRAAVLRRLQPFAERSIAKWDDGVLHLLRKTHSWFLFILSIYVASKPLVLPPEVDRFIHHLTFVALLMQMCVWGSRLITFWIDAYIRDKAGSDGAKITTMRAVGFLTRLVFFSIVILWGLDNFGINITTLVAGLGVGGVAVALAVQNILGDLFASLTIVLDKPFVLGDYVVVGDFAGRIEHVGLKTTRIRSVTQEEIIFPNGALLQSKIRNYKAMHERRSLFGFGVTYETSPENLAAIPQEVRTILESHPKVRFERAHLKQLSNSSVDYEVVYWVLGEYTLLMDIQQDVILSIIKRFAELGIQFAYPTQMVYQKSLN